MLLVNRNPARLSVRGAGRRENEAAHTRHDQTFEQREGLFDVVIEIDFGSFYRFAYIGQRGEVNARFDFMFTADGPDQLSIADLALVKRNVLRDGRPMSALKIVKDHNRLVTRHQLINHRAADVAGASGYKNRHLSTFTGHYGRGGHRG